LKFNRTYTLTVGVPPIGPVTQVTKSTPGPNYGFNQTIASNQQRATDKGVFTRTTTASQSITLPISLEFSIDRAFMSSVNTGTFKLYNLSEEQRNQLLKPYYTQSLYVPVQLRAGYELGNQGLIFNGQVMIGRSYRIGRNNIVTELTCKDNSFMYSNSFSNFTTNPQTTLKQALIDLNSDLLTAFPTPLFGTIPDIQFIRPKSFVGPTFTQIQNILDKYQLNATIDLSQLRVMGKNEGFITSKEPYEISSATGLLDVPMPTDNSSVVCKMLFEPSFYIGQLVKLNSTENPAYNGIYPIYGIKHEGIISPSVNGQFVTTLDLYKPYAGTTPVTITGNLSLPS
jgi:hypothetical protein